MRGGLKESKKKGPGAKNIAFVAIIEEKSVNNKARLVCRTKAPREAESKPHQGSDLWKERSQSRVRKTKTLREPRALSVYEGSHRPPQKLILRPR